MGMEVMYLPRLAETILEDVTADESKTIELKPEAALNLTDEERQLLTIQVPAGSMVDDSGQPVAAGRVGVSVVPPELVRDMLPPGVLQHTFDITIQAEGFTNFSTPAPMTTPNVFNAAPGTKVDFLSFDHNTGLLVIEGTGTVSEDGMSITTDPGTGVTHPGWHGWTPPGGCGGSGGPPPPPPPPPTPMDTVNPPQAPVLVNMITGESGSLLQIPPWNPPPQTNPNLPPPPPAGCNPPPPPPPGQMQQPYLNVNIQVDGPLATFMKQPSSLTGGLPLSSYAFTLRPGDQGPVIFAGEAKDYSEMFGAGGISGLNRDQLYGSIIRVTEIRGASDGSRTYDYKTYVVSRWVDVVDAVEANNHTGSTAVFFPANTDGVVRQKNVDLFLPASVTTSFSSSGAGFGFPGGSGSSATWTFDPSSAGVQTTTVDVDWDFDVEGTSFARTMGSLTARGKSIAPTSIGINLAGYRAQLSNVINALTANDGADGQPGVLGIDDDGNGVVDDITERGWPGADDVIQFLPSNPAANEVASDRFKSAFHTMYPWVTPSATTVSSVLTAESDALLAAVRQDFNQLAGYSVSGGTSGDVTMSWAQFIVDPVFGNLFGFADGDPTPLDQANATVQSILSPTNTKIGSTAQQIFLAEFVNRSVSNSGQFAVAPNISWTSGATFAQYVANTVSHEIAHTFGLLESYDVNGGRYRPFDLMMDGGPTDPNLTFGHDNRLLLQAALGIQNNGDTPLTGALALFQENYNLPSLPPALPRAETSLVFPNILLRGNGLDFSGGELVDAGTFVADGEAGQQQVLTYTIENVGSSPLEIADITLLSGNSGFALAASPEDGTIIAPYSSAILELVFDPDIAGAFEDELRINSNADATPSFTLGFKGIGLSPDSVIDVTVDNSNLAGAFVDTGLTQTDQLATIANAGASPLLISDIRLAEGADQFVLTGIPDDLLASPISLAHAEDFSFGASFSPSRLGLQRATVEIVTNDPANPVGTISLVGTGLDEVVYPDWGNDFVALETPELANSVVLREITDEAGNFNMFLPPSEDYHFSAFDPITGLIAHGYGVTAPSGGAIDLTSTLVFGASTSVDTDFDGLPDDVEFAVGTNPNLADTDDDGLDDYAAVIQGLDPTGGALTTGVIAQLELPGEAKDVVVEGSVEDPAGQTAYIATGSHGLAIVDASEFDDPILIGAIDLPGDAIDVAVDSAVGIAVVATGAGGLQFVDVSDPMLPVLRETVDLNVRQVEIIDGIAYASTGNLIRSFDVLSADLLLGLTPSGGGTITGLAQENGFLYSMDSNRSLRVIDVANFDMIERGNATLPHGAGRLFVDNGIGYAAAINTNFRGGYATADVSDPDNPVAISGSDVPSANVAPGTAVFSNGAGRGILVGPVQGGTNELHLVNVEDPSQTYQFLTRFFLPAPAFSVAVASGIAYVADGNGDLVVVNYLPFDIEGQSPSATISSPVADVDPVTDGVQVVEGSNVPIRVDITDDVQIRNVELLVNGVVVANEVSAPFEFVAPAPSLADGTSEMNIQVRATDTGLNSSLSNALTYELVEDTVPPEVIGTTPGEGITGFKVSSVTVRFNEPLDTGIVDLAGVTLTNLGADGLPGGGDDMEVELLSVETPSDFRVAVRTVENLPFGEYRLVLDPSIIADRAGNNIAEPFELEFTAFDVLPGTIVWISDESGDWDDPSNWSEGQVPTANDDVFIDRVGSDITVTVSGFSAARSLRSSEDMEIPGRLTLTGPSQADASFTVNPDGQLFVSGANGSFVANANTTIHGGSLFATAGGQINLPNVTSYSHAGGSFRDRFLRADGVGSVLDLSNLTEISGNAANSSADLFIQALNGSDVRLGAVQTITGAAQVSASGPEGEVDLSALTQFLDTNPNTGSGITTSNGAAVQMGGLTALSAVNLTIGGQMDTVQLTSFDSASITINDVTADLSGLTELPSVTLTLNSGGSPGDLSGVTNINNASIFVNSGSSLSLPGVTSYAIDDFSTHYLRANGTGAVLSLPNLADITTNGTLFVEGINSGQVDLSGATSIDGAARIISSGTGGQVDISAVTSFVNSTGGFSELTTFSDGQILMPGITELDRISLTIEGQMEVSQLTSFSNASLTINGVAVDLSALTELPGVTLTLNSGGSPGDLSGVTNINNASIFVNGGSSLSLPGVTSYMIDNFFSRNLRANGTGAVLSLPNLADITSNGSLRIEGINSGQVDLSGATSIDGAARIISSGTGGQVDISAVTSFVNSTGGFSELTTFSNGQILMPGITELDRISLTIEGQMDVSQLTSFSNASLTINGVAVDLSALTELPGVTLTLNSGGSPGDLSGVTNINNASIFVNGGSSLSLPGVTSYMIDNFFSRNLRANGTGAVLSLPNLADITSNGSLRIEGINSGQVDLSGATSIDGAARIISSGTGGQVDISAVTSFVNSTGGFSELTTFSNGQILMPGITELDRISLTIEGQMDVSQLTSFSNASLTINGVAVDLSALTELPGVTLTLNSGGSPGDLSGVTNINNASIFVNGGSSLSLPGVTSYAIDSFFSRNLRANGTGAVLSLPNLADITSNGSLRIEGINSGQVDLSGATSIDGAARIISSGTGGQVDISAVTSFVNSTGGFSELTTFSNGQILMPGITELDRISLTIEGQMDVSQLTSFSNASLTINGVAVDLSALTELPGVTLTLNSGGSPGDLSGVTNINNASIFVNSGSSLSLPGVTSYAIDSFFSRNLRANGTGAVLSLSNLADIAANGTLFVEGINSGQVDLSGATSIDGAARIISSGTGGQVDISAVTSFVNSTGGFSELTTFSDGQILMPGITELDRINLTIGGQMDVSQLTSFSNASLTINGVAVDLSALTELPGVTLTLNSGGSPGDLSGVTNINNASIFVNSGSSLSLPGVTSYMIDSFFSRNLRANGTGAVLSLSNLADITSNGSLRIEGINSGQVDLSGATSIDGAARIISSGTGGQVDISAVTSFVNSTGGFSELTTFSDGQILMPGITELDRISLTIEGQMDVSQLTSFSNASLTINGVAVDLSALTELPGVTLTLNSGGSPGDLSGVTNINNASIFVNSGSSLSLPGVTSYMIDSFFSRNLRANGTGAVLSLSNLADIAANGTLFVEGINSGQVDLSGATSIDGAARIISSGTGGQVDISAVTSFVNSTGGFSELTTFSDGQILMPGITELDRINLTIGGQMDTTQLTSIRNASITVSIPNVEFGGFSDYSTINLTINSGASVQTLEDATSFDGGGIRNNSGAPLSFPLVTSYTHGGGNFSTHFIEASGLGSELLFPNLTTITGSLDPDDFNADLLIRSINGGRIDLGSATTINGPARVTATGTGAEVDISSITSFVDSNPSVSSELNTSSGGRIRMAGLTSLENVDLTIGGEMETGQLTDLSDAFVTVNGVNADFGGLTSLNRLVLSLNSGGMATGLDNVVTIDDSSLFVRSGVTLSLPNVTSYTMTGEINRWLQASGTGSAIDLPNVTSISGSPLNEFGTLSIEGVNGGYVNLANATTITGGTRITASGTNGEVDVSSVFTFTDTNSNSTSSLTTFSSGRIRMPNLVELDEVNLSVGGIMDTSQLVSIRNASIDVFVPADFTALDDIIESTLTIRSNGELQDVGALSNIDGASIIVRDGTNLTLPGVTSYTQIVNSNRVIQAIGGGSRLELPNITTITGISDTQTTSGTVRVESVSGGYIDLPALASLSGGPVRLSASGLGAELAATALSTIQSDHDFLNSGIEASFSGTVIVPNLPTSWDGIDLILRSWGQITFNTAQLTAFQNAVLTLDDQTLDVGALANIDGSGAQLTNGATLVLPSVTTYTNSAGRVDRVFSAVGSGTILDLPNLTSITGSNLAASSPFDTVTDLTIRATSEGTVDLPNTTAFLGGVVRVVASGTDAEVDLSSLSSIVSDHPTENSGIQVSGNGSVLLGNLPSDLNRVDLTLGQGSINLDTDSISAFTNANLSIDTTPRSFSSLSNIDSSGLNVFGVALTLPNVTSYANTGGISNRNLQASGFGSVLDLSSLTTIVNDSGQPSTLSITATSRGVIDLSNVTQLTIPAAGANDRAIGVFAGGFESLIDLTSLESFVDSSIDGTSALSSSFGADVLLNTATTSVQNVAVSTTTGGTIAGGTLDIASGSQISGSGTLDGSVSNAGELVTGNSSSGMTITGDYVQTGSGVMRVQIGGTAESGLFRSLVIGGNAALDGTLSIELVNSFVPVVDDQFEVMTFSSRSGDFAVVNGLDLPGDLVFDRVFAATNMTLTAATPQPAAAVRPTAIDVDRLMQEQADHMVTVAIACLQRAGISHADLDYLRGLEVRVADLTDDYLGLSHTNTIVSDSDGAGLGWFYDQTPFSDEEFSHEENRSVRSEALDRYDLLTVILHELGHHLGHDCTENADDWMASELKRFAADEVFGDMTSLDEILLPLRKRGLGMARVSRRWA